MPLAKGRRAAWSVRRGGIVQNCACSRNWSVKMRANPTLGSALLVPVKQAKATLRSLKIDTTTPSLSAKEGSAALLTSLAQRFIHSPLSALPVSLWWCFQWDTARDKSLGSHLWLIRSAGATEQWSNRGSKSTLAPGYRVIWRNNAVWSHNGSRDNGTFAVASSPIVTQIKKLFCHWLTTAGLSFSRNILPHCSLSSPPE